MIEEVLSEISAAEKKAAEMKSVSDTKCAEIIAEGDRNATDILSETSKNVKVLRTNGLYQANLQADKEYKNTLEKSAEENVRVKKSLEDAAETIANELFTSLQ